ncbi:MAG: alpha/beta hydrolase [Candidatus Acidiferrum sp.]|jgi:pimeloyl-ACP methyl ester carboxylesterase
MRQIRILLMCALFGFALATPGQSRPPQQPPFPQVVDLKVSDGTVLKASYYAAAKSGPGVLLFHQSNRTRNSWNELARQLAAAGINTLTVDNRGHGESGGKYDSWTNPNREQARQDLVSDIDGAFQYLVSQPGVNHDVIGIGGAGLLGVDTAVRTARQHSTQVKSLALLSGETFRPGLDFLRQASLLPGLFVVDDNDEYPPTVEAMHLLYSTASNPGKKLLHYPATHEAPWLWYEPVGFSADGYKLGVNVTVDVAPANGGHGTDMFNSHPELPGIIVEWFVTTLIRTPGRAPADSLAAVAILNQLATPDGVAQVTQRLIEGRRRDPQLQLFPEITVGIIGADYLRAGDAKMAIEVMKLVLMAYPDSADANENLAEAYLADRQRDLARHYTEKALALLDSPGVPASSWSNSEPYRVELRRSAQNTLKQLGVAH